MSEVRVNNLSNENNTGGPTISGITTYSGKNFFVPPQGTTAQRPEDCEPGSLRFNTDSAKLEYFRGNTIGWTEIEAELTEPLGGGTGSNTGLGTRGIFYSGNLPSTNVIQFVTISTLGDAQDFGDAVQIRRVGGCFSSRTRCFLANGYADGGTGGVNVIEFVTFASTGNGTNFGDSTARRWNANGFSNATRGLSAGGEYPGTPFYNIIDYVTMSSEGNAVDFGDMLVASQPGQNSAMASSTRGVIAGGQEPGDTYVQHIQHVTTSTLGNASDFGNLLGGEQRTGCCANAVRGVIGAGNPAGNRISFITIATLGDAVDFGDSTTSNTGKAAMSSPTRGIWGGSEPSATNLIEYVEITTTGNAIDFGDLITDGRQISGDSNGHGGL